MADNLNRFDLNEQDVLDIEELKSELGSDAKASLLDSTGYFYSNPNSRPCSAPSTLRKLNLALNLIDLEEFKGKIISASSSDIQSVNMSHVKEIKHHKGSVTSYKRWITQNFELKASKIKEQICKITYLAHQISAFYDVADVPVEKGLADNIKEI